MFRALRSVKNSVSNWISRLMKKQEGATIVEYALLVGLISVVSILILVALGGNVARIYNETNDQIDGKAVTTVPVTAGS